MGNTVIVYGESSCTSCSHGNHKAVKERHTRQEIKQGEKCKESQINDIKDLGRTLELGYNLAKDWSRNFRFHDLQVAIFSIVHNS